ncbi:aspartate kinase [Methanothrix soehngenii]|uniref:aspartate kinase n=2 Tax=Methanothrix soehngenii TaxID=2223 RepID=UPI0023F1F133|nr:aspartate kinase [Methanothrix soehngenii]MDD4487413.1 aspartate kinase [Methanothrix soehngenii]MDD5257410.1 aspartate kinase [Methanothrix soehngenii]MDD5735903.1 aspartate kinase [Methanothrix soehngenii]
MARLVMKFGGVSVADGNRLRHVGDLVRHFHRDNEIVLVTSALQGVTDELLACARRAASEGNVSDVMDFMERITDRHNQAIADAIQDPAIAKEVQGIISEKLSLLEKAYIGICYLGELTRRSLDYISGYGEQLAAPILSGVLRDMGIESQHYTGREAGIITDSNYGDARPLEKTYGLIPQKLLPLKGVPVVTGFIAQDEKGTNTTLGRGGSDLSASLIGAAINADEIWFWKETSGIMTTDPKIVPEAKTIPTISYREAMELSYFGAKVLHPRAIEPAIKKGIPVRVKCTFDPEDPGTQIVRDDVPKEDVIKAVTLHQKVELLNISGAGMIGTLGVAARAFTALAEAGINIVMISQGSSEANISMVIEEGQADRADEALRSEFPRDVVKEISHDHDVCTVAVTGSGMAGTPGVAARVFKAMGQAKINVVMISQASGQHNISFVVASADGERAVRELHREFGLGGEA